MKQELNRKQMEKNSTKVIHSMIYLGEKLKNVPNQKKLPSWEVSFPRRTWKKEQIFESLMIKAWSSIQAEDLTLL